MTQIYVPEVTRRSLQREVMDFTSIYYERLLPALGDIESQAEEFMNRRYEDYLEGFDPWDCVDPSSLAEQALTNGINYYEYLSLGKYLLTSSWHATLYHLFEQQLKCFLFHEMSHYYKLDFAAFCKNLKDIKKLLKDHGIDVEQLPCWSRIHELRLLCNVIKHSDGWSADELRRCNPGLFRQHDDAKLMSLYKSTLLEESLAIDETTLKGYEEAIISFWDEIPERSYA
jgi:hypothetical protein